MYWNGKQDTAKIAASTTAVKTWAAHGDGLTVCDAPGA